MLNATAINETLITAMETVAPFEKLQIISQNIYLWPLLIVWGIILLLTLIISVLQGSWKYPAFWFNFIIIHLLYFLIMLFVAFVPFLPLWLN